MLQHWPALSNTYKSVEREGLEDHLIFFGNVISSKHIRLDRYHELDRNRGMKYRSNTDRSSELTYSSAVDKPSSPALEPRNSQTRKSIYSQIPHTPVKRLDGMRI